MRIEFTWDPGKAASNLLKHRVAFTEAATVFADPLALTVFDRSHSDLEERWFTLGLASDGRLLAVSHTHATGDESSEVRLISARSATRAERRQYENEPS